jgi:hypothetical protein
VMSTLSALLLENGLPNLPVLLVEPHRNYGQFGVSNSATKRPSRSP